MESSHDQQHHHHQRQGSRVRFAEEEPGLEVYHPPSQPARGHNNQHQARFGAATPATTSAADTAPEVYWADDNDNDPNASKYTFYREGTPTPPEYDEQHEKGAGFAFGGGAAGLGAAGAGGQGISDVFPAHGNDGHSGGSTHGSQPDGDGVSPSKRRKFRWVIIVFVVLCVIIPVAVGTGLGLGLKKPGSAGAQGASSGASAGDPTSSTSPEPTRNVTASSSSSTTSTASSTARPVPTLLPGGILPDCPAGNNTLYVVPGLTKTFLRVCGIDYSGAGQATDLSHIYTDSMTDCMNVCASYDKCTGCGWGVVPGDTGPPHRCWMKNDLKIPHKARDDYCFGILQS